MWIAASPPFTPPLWAPCAAVCRCSALFGVQGHDADGTCFVVMLRGPQRCRLSSHPRRRPLPPRAGIHKAARNDYVLASWNMETSQVFTLQGIRS